MGLIPSDAPGTEQAELRLKSRRLTGLTDHARALCCR